MKLAYCISYTRGHRRILGVVHDMVFGEVYIGGLTNNYLSEGCPQN